ncbi:DNA helicase-2 / ATP-dependent DNA helicase PcrA [Oscillibacter sp. PC13]|uniref:ATP-dependent helicase n=1 Tax=Oscillibacter sp. PC13 TaxID=1855299 RepID=UPI0008E80346|nr:UvrD-helicase domain-containing protein [Oscillibacter sp. PC13]SFP56632.1 DNA helicase-2 / ATP-dependent DNA helicase PcrA [Oscillibacter sp. PC13]
MTDFQTRYIAARKAVIARDLQRLNPMQRKAAMTTEGPLLLLAGAGSGKTTVLIQRVYNLLTYGRGSDSDQVPEWATEEDLQFLESLPDQPDEEQRRRAVRLCAVDVPRPWEIIAITFTNKAAGELKERLAARLGPAANDIWASTFHSACVRILRRDIDRIGFDKDFTIYDSDDSKRVIKDILKEQNLDEKTFQPRSVLSVISHSKDQYESPEEFAAKHQHENDWKMARIARIYAAYVKKLRTANALDFDDIIYHTVTLLQQEREVLEYYQNKFRYVLVDEYQDTNHLQYLLTSLLAGGRKNLCVVGDDDQSIYRFRGANIENILNFEQQYKDARTIRLEQNYRSTQNILDAANAVIKHNTGRKGKTLWTDNGGGDAVTVKTTFNESDEANYVVGDILMGVNRGRNFRDTAVLYRMNAQSNALEYAMKRNGIPYKIVGGMKFFDRAEVKDMLAYLCVLNNPMDDLRLRRVINNPPRGIGATTLDKVALLAEQQGASLYEILRNADLFPELKSPAAKLLKFADLIDGLRRAGGTLALPEFYDEVVAQTGYVKALEEKNDMESRGRIENVQELKSNILGFLEQDPEDATLSGFLNEIALYTDLDSVEADDNCVTMMTIHSAKGLEFPNVYVVGMEEGIFPGNSAQYDEEELEEERRLCYVAMTRAKEKLTLTNARQRMLYGRTSANRASRFLEEIPEENMRWESKPEPKFGGMERDGAFGERYGESGGEGRFVHTDSYTTGGGWGGASIHAYKTPAKAAAKPLASTRRNTASAAPILQLQQGDMVEHTAFGRGMVLSVRPMGGDALAEVAFDTVGTKKLMLKSAGSHMKKL